MATVKRLNTSYTLDTTEVIVTGNLTIQGNTTTIDSINTTISDKTLTLNHGEIGSGVGPAGGGSSGIVVDRGLLANVEIIWNDSVDQWQITRDGSTYENIVSSSSGGTILFDDPSPTLSANLNTNGHTIFSGTNYVKFDSNVQLINVTATPTVQSGSTVVYASTPAGGTSGVYVVNSLAANQELITKTRAFGLSLIL